MCLEGTTEGWVPESMVRMVAGRLFHKNYKCKKLQFIHKLTASDTSKTAKITKR